MRPRTGQVRVLSEGTVTLSGDAGRVPVTIVNDLETFQGRLFAGTMLYGCDFQCGGGLCVRVGNSGYCAQKCGAGGGSCATGTVCQAAVGPTLTLAPALRGTAPLNSGNLVFRSHVDLGFRTYVNSVPEPATWAMMIVGFGLVGGSMRRRHTLTVKFA